MKVGFVGLGSMGSGMVRNLLNNGFSVVGFDTDGDKFSEFSDTELEKAISVEIIARSCEVVILCLPNPEASHSVIFDQLLTEKESIVTTIIEASTLTPEIVMEFSLKLKEKGIEFLSTPMIGGKTHAQEGEIEFLIEGTREVFEKTKELLQAMGKTRFMGDIPTATLAKLTFNLSRYANLAVGIESYRLLKEYTANLPAIHEFMSEQSLDNFGQVWAEDLKETMVEDMPYKPSLVPKKDLALLIEMAENNSLDENLIVAIRKTYLSME